MIQKRKSGHSTIEIDGIEIAPSSHSSTSVGFFVRVSLITFLRQLPRSQSYPSGAPLANSFIFRLSIIRHVDETSEGIIWLAPQEPPIWKKNIGKYCIEYFFHDKVLEIREKSTGSNTYQYFFFIQAKPRRGSSVTVPA